jgi:hypothetical protein
MRRHRLARTRHAAPPPDQLKTARLKAAVRQLRQTAHHDRATTEICDEVERLIASGWVERRGGGDRTAPMKLPKELEPYRDRWARSPPEKP